MSKIAKMENLAKKERMKNKKEALKKSVKTKS